MWRLPGKTKTSAPTVIALSPSTCPAHLPSPFCCFAACVDVYRTHSNVHLRCFHTGKSKAIRQRCSIKLPVSSSVVIISVIFILPAPVFVGFGVPPQCLDVWLQPDSCPFTAILSVQPEYEVICFLIISVVSYSLSFKSPLSNGFVPLVLNDYFWGLKSRYRIRESFLNVEIQSHCNV